MCHRACTCVTLQEMSQEIIAAKTVDIQADQLRYNGLTVTINPNTWVEVPVDFTGALVKAGVGTFRFKLSKDGLYVKFVFYWNSNATGICTANDALRHQVGCVPVQFRPNYDLRMFAPWGIDPAGVPPVVFEPMLVTYQLTQPGNINITRLSGALAIGDNIFPSLTTMSGRYKLTP
jgi:hypothetical protein